MRKLSFLLLLLFVLMLCGCSNKAPDIENVINKTVASQVIKNASPTVGQTGGEWNIISLKSAGYEDDAYYAEYIQNLGTYLTEKNGNLGEKSTEYSRLVICLYALGENPSDFYSFDLLSPLTDVDFVKRQGVNGVCFALLALSKEYLACEAAKLYKNYLLSCQNTDGGFCVFGKKSDPNTTAMVLQSLYPFRDEAENVIQNAFSYLENEQNKDGGYESFGDKGPEAAAQVLIALSMYSISPDTEGFAKKYSLTDNILSYYKNGEFSHTKDFLYNAMSTEQCLLALAMYERKK